MSEELEVLKEVARRLDGAGFRYMVTGSIAVSYYAVPRMTRDIDVVVDLSGPDADRICRLFEDDFYVDSGAVAEAIHERGMFNIIHNEFVIKVDFVVRKEGEYRREEFSRRRRVTVEGCRLFLVAPEDLILSSWTGPGRAAPRSNWPMSGTSWPVPQTSIRRTWSTGPPAWASMPSTVRCGDDGHPPGGGADVSGSPAPAVGRGSAEDGMLHARDSPIPGPRLGPGRGPACLARRRAPGAVPPVLRTGVRRREPGEDPGRPRARRRTSARAAPARGLFSWGGGSDVKCARGRET